MEPTGQVTIAVLGIVALACLLGLVLYGAITTLLNGLAGSDDSPYAAPDALTPKSELKVSKSPIPYPPTESPPVPHRVSNPRS